jgi:hypothetical protein
MMAITGKHLFAFLPTHPAANAVDAMSDDILALAQAKNKLYLHGPFGSGKTTLAIARIRWLLQQERVRGDQIAVILPQRTLNKPYVAALTGEHAPRGAQVVLTTFASLVKQAVERYWPQVYRAAGFTASDAEPTFLTLETSQYHMAPLVDGAMAKGDFDGIRVERGRIISQVLDNLNKAALQDMEIPAAYQRLELAVPPTDKRVMRLHALKAAEEVSHEFRALCLRENLLDFSLQVLVFNRFLLSNDWCRTSFFRTYRHIVYDNAEEDTASTHGLVRRWLPHLHSALIIADEDGGFRTYLNADPQGVEALAAACDHRRQLHARYITTPALDALDRQLDAIMLRRIPGGLAAQPALAATGATTPKSEPLPLIVSDEGFRFYPQMIGWAAQTIRQLVEHGGVAPEDIAVLSPFVSDALRFQLETALAIHQIEVATNRPSRELRAEPASQALMTLAKLAHPHWGARPHPADVTQMLALCVLRLDPVRAALLSEIIYPPKRATIELGRFADLTADVRKRITFAAGEEYDRLQQWLYRYRAEGEPLPLDQFFARLFGELLSQPGYGFHDNPDAARAANQLTESARKFRWTMESSAALPGPLALDAGARVALEYLRLAESGVIGALFAPGWRPPERAVFLAPASTFLMSNRPVRIQIWLDMSAPGWGERIYQPLTNPFVLSPNWPPTQPWNDAAETKEETAGLRRLLLGLIRRCRERIYVGLSDYGEHGMEQNGPLLGVLNQLLAEERKAAG